MQILSAPIQEYTDAAFRSAHAKTIGGIDEYYAPFARLEKGVITQRMQNDLAPTNNQHGLAVPQILVKTSEETSYLLNWLSELGYRRVDLNFGCPFPKIVQRGYGAGILADINAVAAVLEKASSYSGIGISVKMRLGSQSSREAFDIVPILNRFPLVRIVLHPRTAAQQYEGLPDKDAFLRFQEQCSYPVVYNGDIRSPKDAEGFNAAMIGRGLLENPLLPLQLNGQPAPITLLKKFHQAYAEHCTLLYHQPLQKLKLIWEYLLPQMEKKLRKDIIRAKTLDEYLEATSRAFHFTPSTASASHPHGMP